jgi:hypothetical protein
VIAELMLEKNLKERDGFKEEKKTVYNKCAHGASIFQHHWSDKGFESRICG